MVRRRMNARLLVATRIVKRVLSLLAGVLVVLALAASLAIYLAATGKSLPLLHIVTAGIGRLMSAQQTEQLTVDVRLVPAHGRLTATAMLTVRSLEEKRQRFYFLLNDGLRLRDVRVSGVDATRQAPAAFQFSLLTIVDVGTPVAKDGVVQLTFEYDGDPTRGMFAVGSNILDPRQVLLNVDSFWYPSDVQSFFTASVAVTLPRGMTVVHNGSPEARSDRGDVQQVRWTSERRIAGLSLVAGAYAVTSRQTDGTAYQVYLPEDVQLDAPRILELMAKANRTLTEHYGSSAFKRLTLFVNRAIRRGFNDGAGVMGLSLRYFRAGDYGFATIAHEIAHNWWGGTVAEQWLTPGTGGEWIVEGFAEFSSLVATEAEYGVDARTRRLAGEFFDPARAGVIADMSVLDNALAETTARDTIYRKGAYVAMMLRQLLGDEVYFRSLRQFLERYQYRHATDHDVQQVLEEASGQKLDQFFDDWVRSDRLADLSLDSTTPGTMTVTNLGSATVSGDIDLWTFKKGRTDADRSTVHVGESVPWGADAEVAILDPQGKWVDVQRENNRYPRRNDPVHVAAAAGEVAVTHGQGLAWTRTAVSSIARSGRTEHTWDFDRGLLEPPLWSPDDAKLIVSYAEAGAALPAIVTLAADGSRRTVGHGTAPSPTRGGVLYAGTNDRIVRIANDAVSTVVRRHGEVLDRPLPSPDFDTLAYTATRGNHLELRAVGVDGQGDRLLMSSDRDRLLYRWSTDGTHLYAAAGGTWDWQIWDVPLGDDSVGVLASGAAAIADLAVAPDGKQLAFTGAPALDYPVNRARLYVMHLADRDVRTIDVANADLGQLTWVDPDSLLVVATDAFADQPQLLPARRTLKRVRPSDGSIEDVP